MRLTHDCFELLVNAAADDSTAPLLQVLVELTH